MRGRKPKTNSARSRGGLPDVPREILWDYAEAPKDLLWRLQRLADFFPHWGRDRKTVRLLDRYKGRLKIPPETHYLIRIYREGWDKLEEERKQSRPT